MVREGGVSEFIQTAPKGLSKVAENRALVDSPARRSYAERSHVYVPLVFEKGCVRLTRTTLLLLNAYRVGRSLKDAAREAGITEQRAIRILKQRTVQTWLRDRSRESHIRQKWEGTDYWWQVADDVIEGRREMKKGQIDLLKEFGDRIVPKPVRVGDARPASVEIHVNLNELEASKQRRKEWVAGEVVTAGLEGPVT